MFEVSGSTNHTLNAIWDQRPEILGTWTLWVSHRGIPDTGLKTHDEGSDKLQAFAGEASA